MSWQASDGVLPPTLAPEQSGPQEQNHEDAFQNLKNSNVANNVSQPF